MDGQTIARYSCNPFAIWASIEEISGCSLRPVAAGNESSAVAHVAGPDVPNSKLKYELHDRPAGGQQGSARDFMSILESVETFFHDCHVVEHDAVLRHMLVQAFVADFSEQLFFIGKVCLEKICKFVHHWSQNIDTSSTAPIIVNLGPQIEDRLVLGIDFGMRNRKVIPSLDEVSDGKMMRLDSAKQRITDAHVGLLKKGCIRSAKRSPFGSLCQESMRNRLNRDAVAARIQLGP